MTPDDDDQGTSIHGVPCPSPVNPTAEHPPSHIPPTLAKRAASDRPHLFSDVRSGKLRVPTAHPDNQEGLPSNPPVTDGVRMAQQTTVRFIDDLDGSDAVGTFDFSLEGRSYQIDLSDDNAAKLRAALTPFIDAARKADGPSSGRGRARA